MSLFLRFMWSLTIWFNVTLCELRVKIRNIHFWFYIWNEWCLLLFLKQGFPVNSCEPRMVFNLKGTFGSQSILRFLLEKTLKQISQLVTHKNWDFRICKLYLVKKLSSAFGVERRQTDNHFIDNRAKTPPINRFTMTLFVKNFRCKILWGSANGCCIWFFDFHPW